MAFPEVLDRRHQLGLLEERIQIDRYLHRLNAQVAQLKVHLALQQPTKDINSAAAPALLQICIITIMENSGNQAQAPCLLLQPWNTLMIGAPLQQESGQEIT